MFAGVPKQPGFQDGPLLRARFASPSGIVVSERTHEAFIADTENNAIRRIALRRNFVTTLSIHLSPMFSWVLLRTFVEKQVLPKTIFSTVVEIGIFMCINIPPTRYAPYGMLFNYISKTLQIRTVAFWAAAMS